MDFQESVTIWIEQLRAGRQEAAQTYGNAIFAAWSSWPGESVMPLCVA